MGQGVEVNLTKAYSFVIAAARKGDQAAWRKVADLYLQGRGVDLSVEKAKYWLKKLSNSGDIQASQKLKKL